MVIQGYIFSKIKFSWPGVGAKLAILKLRMKNKLGNIWKGGERVNCALKKAKRLKTLPF